MASAIRRQYLDLKARHPDAILFFRLGDFYETFDDDAELVSRTLGVTLTSKPMGQGLRVPLAGVPVQSVEGHLARLIAAGQRVAIAEQLEDPGARGGAGKGLVRRGIVRVVSPGTALEPSLLEAGRNAYCAAISIVGPSGAGSSGAGSSGTGSSGAGPARAGVALADLSTGELRGCELEAADAGAARAAALAELERLGARELLLPLEPESGPVVAGGGPSAAAAAAAAADADEAPPWTLTPRPRDRFAAGRGAALLRARFGVADVQGLGLAGRPALLGALGALLDYLGEGQGDPGPAASGGDPGSVLGGVGGGVGNGAVGGVVGGVVSSGVSSGDRLAHLGRPQIYDPSATMRLDAATRRALDIFPAPGGGSGSLLALLDRCRTAAGRRLLRARLERPLIALAPIEARQARVALLHEAALLRARLRQRLAEVPDLERLLGRVATGLATPPELATLGRGLDAAAALAEPIEEEEEQEQEAAAGEGAGDAARAALLRGIRESLPQAEAAAGAIAAALAPEPELFADARGDGAAEVLRPGYDAEVDALRLRRREGRRALAALEAEERRRTGVAALKVGFHRSFGYYIELGRSHAAAAPPDWERRQTLAGGERYVSPRLRALERELLEARDALALRERELYAALCRRVAAEAAAVRRLAAGVARLDAEAALAEVAAANGWTRPQLDHSARLEIREGRHPLVEAGVAAGLGAGRFVPNDVALDGAGTQMLVVTGPNMAGKSTYLRQTALIVLLAQIGGFVPAARARLGLVDRIFARVGAQDEIAAGRSSFMVEMLETAAICSSATPRSLLVLDEIGRGTSTYDGLAIARALLEHLVSGREGPRTLFATHFHELAALAGEVERVANASVLVAETPGGGGLRYLYRIVPGGADRSYGVHVAAMAGLPAPLLARARELLAALESGSARGGGGGAGRNGARARLPAAIEGSAGEPLLRELAALDVDGLTPLEAIGALYALRERARALAPGAPASHEQTPHEQAPGMPPPQLLREAAR